MRIPLRHSFIEALGGGRRGVTGAAVAVVLAVLFASFGAVRAEASASETYAGAGFELTLHLSPDGAPIGAWDFGLAPLETPTLESNTLTYDPARLLDQMIGELSADFSSGASMRAIAGLPAPISDRLTLHLERDQSVFAVTLPEIAWIPPTTVVVEYVSKSAQIGTRPAEGAFPPGVSPAKAEEDSQNRSFDILTRIRLSDIMSVSAGYARTDSVDSGASTSTTSVGVSLGTGLDTGLSLGRITGKVSDGGSQGGDGEVKTVTTLDLRYSLKDFGTLRASYEAVSTRGEPDNSLGALAASHMLGIGYDVSLGGSAFIQAAYTYQLIRDSAAADIFLSKAAAYDASSWSLLSLSWLLGQAAELQPEATRTTASLGVGYSFTDSASLVIGYKLVDFVTSQDQRDPLRTNLATAELTIRF